jgi:hypothetical protein
MISNPVLEGDVSKYRYIFTMGLLAAVSLFCCARPALSIVLHPDGEPNLLTWTDRPDLNVIGRWGSNATCVAISSNCVITVRHAGGDIGTLVRIGGKTYTIAQIWNHSTADLRLIKLKGANLANFVDIYESTDEAGKSIVIGGYGDGRAGLLQQMETTYGYQWDNSSNTTRRFGTNKINGTYNNSSVGGYTSDIIFADFDGLGEGDSTIYEGAVADHDSGCGWFIKVGNTWQVAGLSRAVELHYQQGHEGDPNYFIYDQSWFRNRDDPDILDPDYIDAVRLSSYATWLYNTIPDVLPGDLNGDDYVDFRDFAVFTQFWLNYNCHAPDWCLGADCEPDGDVDWADLAALADGWLCNWDCY